MKKEKLLVTLQDIEDSRRGLGGASSGGINHGKWIWTVWIRNIAKAAC